MGNFKDDLINGQGILLYKNDDIFFGQLVDGKKINGELYLSDGNKYTGNFVGDKFDGEGTMNFQNGDIYNGLFKNGQMNGQGTMIFHNGDSYIGNFKDGQMNEQGTMTFQNGNNYTGNFKDGQMNGQGVLIENGISFQGDFVNGQKAYSGNLDINGRHDGNGRLVFQNGDVYEGEFKKNQIDGQGTVIFQNGDVYTGLVKNGTVNSLLQKSSMIFGKLPGLLDKVLDINNVNNVINGIGVMNYNNGNKYTGNFVNGKRDGKGIYIDNLNNTTYDGDWSNNEQSGIGTLTDNATGAIIYQGNWQNGQQSPDNKDTNKVTDPRLIPKLFKIRIKTNVPGFQDFEFQGSMIDKNVSSSKKGVLIYPLIKLNQSIVDKKPESIRKKEFFDEGLFKTLLMDNGSYYPKTLDEAIKAGYINNNIIVTLNTLFSTGSVINLGNQPYAIAGYLYDNGSWKVDLKVNEIKKLDSSQFTNDPILYNAMVRNEIISGQQELQQLSPSMLYGPNYTGPRESSADRLLYQLNQQPIGIGTGLGFNQQQQEPMVQQQPIVVDERQNQAVSDLKREEELKLKREELDLKREELDLQ